MSALKIDEHKSVRDFQKEFTQLFPFLKIEFYKSSVGEGGNKSQKTNILLAPNYVLGKKTISINIDRTTTVAELKAIISEKTGVACLVYRKSGTIWIEISLTEDWTLDRQNHEAELINNNSI
ncbi:MAG: hypothetical protein KF860_00485 [Cyclobacteriaceae bacterium]|nr:hypothetical protein [Cyclobacteriaceae bacterium]